MIPFRPVCYKLSVLLQSQPLLTSASMQDVVFEPVANKFLISGSSDATFALWQ